MVFLQVEPDSHFAILRILHTHPPQVTEVCPLKLCSLQKRRHYRREFYMGFQHDFKAIYHHE